MCSNQQGFSLLEVLIALLLIGIASLALIKMQVYTEQRADFAVKSLESLNLMEQKLEWFRTREADPTLSAIPVADFELITNGSESHPPYQLIWKVTTPSSPVSSALKHITITAHWQDRLGKPQQVTLNTMIAKHGEFISR
ncbi:prepilin-type N-terminal cleavage/methylation domain-containing protein [Vibrio bivalvicida]|uniref:Prepilin-type N-terminal cleavage/methylation domain-containing protein n=1 Tax=Vibrio bivalvicida TaxID=1276888 RepID=A0ABV4MF98_9VIBR